MDGVRLDDRLSVQIMIRFLISSSKELQVSCIALLDIQSSSLGAGETSRRGVRLLFFCDNASCSLLRVAD